MGARPFASPQVHHQPLELAAQVWLARVQLLCAGGLHVRVPADGDALLPAAQPAAAAALSSVPSISALAAHV
jgi:hypothetical protein